MNAVWHNDVENDKHHFISPVKACGNWHTMHTIPHGSDIPAHSSSASGGARCVIWQRSHLFMMLMIVCWKIGTPPLFLPRRYTEIPCGFGEPHDVTVRRKMIDGGCKSQHSLTLIKRTLLAFFLILSDLRENHDSVCSLHYTWNCYLSLSMHIDYGYGVGSGRRVIICL